MIENIRFSKLNLEKIYNNFNDYTKKGSNIQQTQIKLYYNRFKQNFGSSKLINRI